MKRFLLVIICFVLLFSQCDNPDNKNVASQENDSHINNMSSAILNSQDPDETENLSIKDKLKSIIMSEKEGLRQELKEEICKDPEFIRKNGPPPEQYADYCTAMERLETLLAKMSGDSVEDAEYLAEVDVIEKHIQEIDPDGLCFRYDESIRMSETEFGLRAYYTGENSPYKDGIDESNAGFYPDIAEAYISSAWPQGMVWYALSKACVTGHFVVEGTETHSLYEFYTSEEVEKEIALGGRDSFEDHYFMIEVTECYWGDYEKGDLIAFAPRSLGKELQEDIKQGKEWFFFLGEDGEKYHISYNGKEYQTMSTRTHAIFRITDGKVSSISRYRDFTQYNGNTPEELALAMLRIREKYRYMVYETT